MLNYLIIIIHYRLTISLRFVIWNLNPFLDLVVLFLNWLGLLLVGRCKLLIPNLSAIVADPGLHNWLLD